MRLLLVHSGHSFSTSDVYDGLLWGFGAIGVEVVEFRWDIALRTLNRLCNAAVVAGELSTEQSKELALSLSLLASADLLNFTVEAEVDAALVVNGLLLPPQRAHVLQKAGIPIGCYGTEAPYFIEAESVIAPAYTHWFTQERRSVAHFADLLSPERSHYLPMAYNPNLHAPADPDPAYACDAVFVGGGYPERKALLDGANWEGIDFRRFGTLWDLDLSAERPSLQQSGQTYSKGSIPNSETTKWHQNARISLNLHRHMKYIEDVREIDPSTAESLGPRAYEIPAAGGFMLCDDERPELLDVFGESAATFRAGDSADLERQARYWLAHPDSRDRVAQAQREAVAPHTWAERAQRVASILF